MDLFKRFELWVLLILIGGGLYYVFNIQGSDDKHGRAPIAATDSDNSDKPEPLPRFSLLKTTVTRDGDRFLAEIKIHCLNEKEQVLDLAPPVTRLLAAGGHEIPPFFLPFQAPLKIPGSGETDVTLRYWLSHDEINGPVLLKIDNDMIPIKTGGFKNDLLPDKQSHSFTATDWNSKT